MLHRDPLATVRQIEVAPEHVARVLVAWAVVATAATPTDVALRPPPSRSRPSPHRASSYMAASEANMSLEMSRQATIGWSWAE